VWANVGAGARALEVKLDVPISPRDRFARICLGCARAYARHYVFVGFTWEIVRESILRSNRNCEHDEDDQGYYSHHCSKVCPCAYTYTVRKENGAHQKWAQIRLNLGMRSEERICRFVQGYYSHYCSKDDQGYYSHHCSKVCPCAYTYTVREENGAHQKWAQIRLNLGMRSEEGFFVLTPRRDGSRHLVQNGGS